MNNLYLENFKAHQKELEQKKLEQRQDNSISLNFFKEEYYLNQLQLSFTVFSECSNAIVLLQKNNFRRLVITIIRTSEKCFKFFVITEWFPLAGSKYKARTVATVKSFNTNQKSIAYLVSLKK